MSGLEKKLTRITIEFETPSQSADAGSTLSAGDRVYLAFPASRSMGGRTGPVAVCKYESDARRVGASWGADTDYSMGTVVSVAAPEAKTTPQALYAEEYLG